MNGPSPILERRLPMTGTPEQLAMRVLGFLTSRPERLAAFSNVTGLRLSQLRHERMQRTFHLGVLDFLLANGSDLAAFLVSDEAKRADIVTARERLAQGSPANTSLQALRDTVDELEGIARSLKANQRRAGFRIVG